jgi:hypothetical protein
VKTLTVGNWTVVATWGCGAWALAEEAPATVVANAKMHSDRVI